MIRTGDLARAAETALALTRGVPALREAEVFAAANATLLARLCYTSHIPCNGVEEPKSTESVGLGIRAVFDGPGGSRVGFGSEAGDLTPDGARRAIAKARDAAVPDPDFVSLPHGPAGGPPPPVDPDLMALDDRGLVEAGWTVVGGALRAFLASSALAVHAGDDAALRRLGLIVGGDVTVVQERVAVASTRLPDVRTDESALVTALVTAMVEAHGAKGTGTVTGIRLDAVSEEVGAQAARGAVAAIGGRRVPSGTYDVVFGPQAVADLVNNLIAPSCSATAFYAGSTPFLGKLGHSVASPLISVYDDGARPGLAGTKGITCEGLPTGRTDLIAGGVLAGCLSNWYETQRLLRDPALARKLGATGTAAEAALTPRNGFRFAPGGGRRFDTPPGVAASNVVVEGTRPVSLDSLLREVGTGLYVGRIWYTYAVNGLAAGDFTCTVVGDSHLIHGGRLGEPLRANAVRISDNITRLLTQITGVAEDPHGTVVWAADEVVYAPAIAVRAVPVDAIAGFVEDLP